MVSRFERENKGGAKFDKSNNKASSSHDSLATTKGIEDEGMRSFPNLSEASGTSNATDTRMQVDSRQNTNGNSLSSFVVVLDDVNKTQINFHVLTTPASSKCEVLISRSFVNEVGDDIEIDVEDVFEETGNFMVSKQLKNDGC
nr:hypothetical protein [Tanacetum cinerariifolium]